MDWIYLDNNATTQPAPQVVDAMHEMAAELWANPSSVHRFGQMARQRIELARASIAKLIGCRDRELILTSGGTESNNLALRGALLKHEGRRVLITTPIEHSAIREPADDLKEAGVEVITLPVDITGYVEPDALRDALLSCVEDGASVLVSIQWANNETGVILPIAEFAKVVQESRDTGVKARILFHSDATQAVGKMPVDVKETGVDLLTLSAHKFHGPKGAGALFVRTGVRLHAQQIGGPQERERRAGTENTIGIVGMGVAAELAEHFVADTDAIERLRGMRDRFECTIMERVGDMLGDAAIVNSRGRQRVWNTTNVGFPRLEAEAILLGLSERGVCASAGAACSSGSLEPSPVLLAMGIAEPVAHGSVRFSLSRFTTDDDIDRAAALVPDVIHRLGKTLPMGT